MYIRLVEHNTSGEFACVICGELCEQNHVAAVLMPDGKDDWRQDALGDVCPVCLSEGQVRAAGRCRTYVNDLRRWADNLEQLATEVEKMTADAWKTPGDFDAFEEEVQARFRS